MPYLFRMATRSRTVVAITAFALLALTGCQPDGPTVEPDPTPTVPPIFESDEEALAAAEEAYGRYLAVSDQITADGGSEADRVEPFVHDSLRDEIVESFEVYQEQAIRTKGSLDFDSMTLQSLTFDDSGFATVRIYACLDFTNIQVLDSEDRNVTPDSANGRVPFELAFTTQGGTEDVPLLLEESEVWTGTDFCASS